MNDVEYTRKVKVWRGATRSAKGDNGRSSSATPSRPRQPSLHGGTRFVDAAEEPELGCEVKARLLSDTMNAHA